MKRYLIILIIVVMLFVPMASTLKAQSPQSITMMLETIEALKAQIESLQIQLNVSRSSFGRITPSQLQVTVIDNPDAVSPIEIYDGEYEAVYRVTYNTSLSLIHGSTKKAKSHLAIWELFTDIVGESFVRNEIDEFRVYSSIDATHSGFVALKRDGKWILGVNTVDVDFSNSKNIRETEELLIHEFSHILFADESRVREKFVLMFWDRSDFRHSQQIQNEKNEEKIWDLMDLYYSRHAHEFVTPYAATSPDEDLAETFTYFVLHDEPRSSDEEVDGKVLFMYDYYDFVDVRNWIRFTLDI